MRTVKIQGGLGNQLFGLAFARSLRLAQGGPVALDIASYRWDKYGRRFMVGEIVERIGGLAIVERPLLAHRLSSAAARLIPVRAPGFNRETPPCEGFDLTAFAGRRGYFDGYWQDEAYILDGDAWPSLFGDFVTARTAAPARPADLVIHYRTYKEENHPAFSLAPGRDYFLRALEVVEKTCPSGSEVMLVSDDAALALERIGDIGRRVVVRDSEGWVDDMDLMLNAKALILTNSSFSWWAGYCGRADVVTYPSRGRLFHYPMPAARFICC